MISVDVAMAAAFGCFFLVFGRAGAKQCLSFLDHNKKDILLSIQQSEDSLTHAQERLSRARAHKEKISDQMESLLSLSFQDADHLILQKAQQHQDIEKKYQDLYETSLKRLLDQKKIQVIRVMMDSTVNFMAHARIGKDTGVGNIAGTLRAKSESSIKRP